MATKLSNWNIIGKIKFEIALILLCILQCLKLPLYLTTVSSTYKDIFEGLNITFSPLTQLVLTMSDLVISWWFFILPAILLFTFIIAFFLIKLLMRKTAENPEGDSAAKFQISTIIACILVLAVLLFTERIAYEAIMSPIFKLISAL